MRLVQPITGQEGQEAMGALQQKDQPPPVERLAAWEDSCRMLGLPKRMSWCMEAPGWWLVASGWPSVPWLGDSRPRICWLTRSCAWEKLPREDWVTSKDPSGDDASSALPMMPFTIDLS